MLSMPTKSYAIPDAKRSRTEKLSEESSEESSDESSNADSTASTEIEMDDPAARPMTFSSASLALVPTTTAPPEYYELLDDPEFLRQFSKKLTDQDQAGRKLYQQSIVHIFSAMQQYDAGVPEAYPTSASNYSTGFILEYSGHNFIVTSSDLINYITYISVRLSDDGRYYNAKVIVVDHDCGLALLTVEQPEFWLKTKPLKLGKPAILRQPVIAIGYPIGGEELCITDGDISRMEVAEYAQSRCKMLRVQMTAALNEGNTGGPVLNSEGEVVGVALQARNDGEGLNYIVPIEILEHFLRDYILTRTQPGGYRGFPHLAIETQKITTQSLRDAKGLKDEIGIIITKVHPLCSADGILQVGDVLLALDGCKINNDGSICTKDLERISFTHLITCKFIYDTIHATILRGQETLELSIPLLYRAFTTTLAGPCNYATPPTYFIVSGVILTPVTQTLINGVGLGAMFSDQEQLDHFEDKPKKVPGEETVVIHDILTSQYSRELLPFKSEFITEVNGHKINNLREIIAALDANQNEFHLIKTNQDHLMPLKKLTIDEHQTILLGCPDRSKDLLRAAEYKPGCPEYEAFVTRNYKPVLRPTA
jgi:S1-C subfamily serine protease